MTKQDSQPGHPDYDDEVQKGETRDFDFGPDFNKWCEENEKAGEFMKDALDAMDYEKDGYYQMYEKIKSALSYFVMAETEDEINDEYTRQVEDFFARRYDVFNEMQDEKVEQFQTKTLSDPTPAFSRKKSSFKIKKQAQKDEKKGLPPATDVHLTKIDRYGLLTLSLIDARMHEEIKDCCRDRVKIFYTNFLQFAIAIVIFALGSEELDGGQFPPLLASYVAAIVAVFASVYGVLGAIGENEGYLVKFMVANFWLMAILTTFLYTEIYMVKNTYNQCEPSKTSYGTESTEGCEQLYGTYATLLIMGLCELLVVFVGAALATNVLDSVNDKTRLQQKQLFFTYFRIRNYEAKKYHTTIDPSCVYRQALDDDIMGADGLQQVLASQAQNME
eukprot:TRINITY_DN462_c1_g3_i1.p1 TRINITY_DN462_c1_g3~~TRINITY_DN462_c1_g3_i1.p1  ORF type:complete len:408 (+),score=117.47 TRINITY_DN462_c1_g3_i1:59-1225(+)